MKLDEMKWRYYSTDSTIVIAAKIKILAHARSSENDCIEMIAEAQCCDLLAKNVIKDV